MDSSTAVPQAGPASRRTFALAAGVATVFFALVAPGFAAEPSTAPEVLPAVVVTGVRGAGETPAEAAYAGTVFQQLEKASRYPTGREASLTRPSGTTTVWVDLQRSGKVVGHGIASRSGSALLDRAALELATRHRYGALPADSWNGEAKHRFVVSYRFDGPAMTAGKIAGR